MLYSVRFLKKGLCPSYTLVMQVSIWWGLVFQLLNWIHRHDLFTLTKRWRQDVFTQCHIIPASPTRTLFLEWRNTWSNVPKYLLLCPTRLGVVLISIGYAQVLFLLSYEIINQIWVEKHTTNHIVMWGLQKLDPSPFHLLDSIVHIV